jgi:hypothetical protein
VRLIELKGSNLRQFPVTGEEEESAGRRVMTGGVHLAAGEREGAGYRFGIWLGGLRAETRAGPKRFPQGPFLFLFFFSSFLFLFSLFLSNTFQI